MSRDTKKPTPPPRTRRRSTRRDPEEPSTSTKPTRRDLSASIAEATASARGQFSIPSARNVQVDAVSGSIEVDSSAGRRPVQVELLSATRRDITVRVRDQVVTMDRAHALALAQIIAVAFD